MVVSVILSTYNSPDLLERTLAGYSRQTVEKSFEVVVADDGSSDETRELVDRLRRDFELDLRHVWHEDRGFRKCEILNRAIEQARGEYLVFSDGDCIPWSEFLAIHLRLACRGRFLSGGYFHLPRELSEGLTVDDVRQGRAESLEWLHRHGLPRSWRSRRLGSSASVGRIFDLLTPTRPSWNGHNASGWKDDLVQVNGFDERMGWGGEDRELGERLVNLGLRGVQIRHRALCLHQWHERSYVNDEVVAENLRMRGETARERATYTTHGIVKSGGSAARA